MMTTGPAPMCFDCIHFHANGRAGCAAFPGGIPLPIINNEADHRKPYKGDHGIRFEAADPDYESPAFGVFDDEN